MDRIHQTALLALLALLPETEAAAEPLPAPNSVAWHSASTVHCTVHWHDGAATTGRRVLDLCDSAWERLTRAVGHRPAGRLQVIVRDLEARSDGLTDPDARQITLWATPPHDRLRGRVDWLPSVLTHEMAHVVAADLADPLRGTLAVTVLRRDGLGDVDAGGRATLDGRATPFWWVEGSADYWAELSGVGRWTTSRDMLLRAAVLESNLLDQHEWTSREDRHALGGELGYNQGYSFGRYLRERLSDGALAALGRAQQRAAAGGVTWGHGFEEVLGASAGQVYADWLARARAAYGDQTERRGPEVAGAFVALDPRDVPADAADPRSPTDRRLWEASSADASSGGGGADRWIRRRRLARPGTVFVDRLRYSRDGRWLGYTDGDATVLLPLPRSALPPRSGRWLSSDVWEGLDAHRLAARHGFSFSPDSAAAVLASSRCLGGQLGCLRPDALSGPDLFRVDLATGEARRLTSQLRATEPAWSPDGRHVAFVRNVDGQSWLGLLDPETPEAGVVWLLKRTDDRRVGRPRWSPDGRRLVFTLARGLRQDIWSIGRGGGDLRPLTWDEAEERDPVYGPRGRFVYFASDRLGVFDLHRIELATGKLDRLTNVRGGAFQPVVLPDGDLLYLYFTSFGFKPYYLSRPASLERAEVRVPEPLEVARTLARERVSPPPEPAQPGPPRLAALGRRLLRPAWVPALVLDGGHVSVGALLDARDAPGVVALSAAALVGESQLLSARLEVGLVPSPFAEVRWLRSAEHFGIPLDPDEDSLTLGQQQVLGVKATGHWFDARAGLALPLGSSVRLEGWGSLGSAGVRFASDGPTVAPLFERYGVAWSLLTNTRGRADREGDVDPRGLSLYVEHGFYGTDLPTERWDAVELVGRSAGAGAGLDYGYQRAVLDAAWAVGLPAPAGLRHTLEVALHAGWISRNVSAAEELYAGGLHPLHLFRPDYAVTALPGYEDFAAHGETLVVVRAAWRTPLLRELHLRVGPLYMAALWLQLGGSVGNAWGYDADWLTTPQGTVQTHTHGPAVPLALRGRPRAEPGSIRRERPFLDVARNNGNRLLLEAGAELRLDLELFERPWDSMVRLSYGFTTLRGLGDVNDDGVLADHFPHDPFVDELEPPSLRLVIALGTGLP